MESHRLEIVLHSAKDLYDIKFFGTMNPYATFWVAGGGVVSEICKTNVTKKAGSYPVWDYPMEFKVNPTTNDYVLFCEIQHEGKLFDRMIGEVQVPFTELLARDGSRKKATYPVKMPNSGEVKGKIIISHKFSERVVAFTDKGSRKIGTKKKDGSLRMISSNREGRSTGKAYRPKEKVKGKKKDRLMKQIVKNVGTKVGSKAVLLAGTVGAIFAGKFVFDGKEDEVRYEDEDEYGNEDEYELEEEDEVKYEDEEEYVDEIKYVDEDEYGNEDEYELEEEDEVKYEDEEEYVDEIKYVDEDEYGNEDGDEYGEEDGNEDEVKYEDDEEDQYRDEDEDEYGEEEGNENEDEDDGGDEDEDEYEDENADEEDGNEDDDDDYNDEYADEYY